MSRKPRFVKAKSALAADRRRQRESNQLSELCQVNWHGITRADVLALQDVLRRRSTEGAMQRLLTKRAVLLVQHLPGGHGRWVIPKKKLGSEYVPDFLIGYRDSIGDHWTAVELEGPEDVPMTSKGRQSQDLRQAVDQIHDWRKWLGSNLDYAYRPRGRDGLGLDGINPRLDGLILIGRRAYGVPDSSFNVERQRLDRDDHIDVHSYEWLLDLTADRLDKGGRPLALYS